MYFKYVFQLLVFQLLHNTARDMLKTSMQCANVTDWQTESPWPCHY